MLQTYSSNTVTYITICIFLPTTLWKVVGVLSVLPTEKATDSLV